MQNPFGDVLSTPSYKQPAIDVHKPSEQSEPRHPSAPEKPLLSFLPAGKVRSGAEHLLAALCGALLLFLFFMASEAAVLLMADTPLMSITFVPVICLLPVLAGALAVIVFEKLRKAQPGMRRGAAVGALAGFCGSMLSAIILSILALLGKQPLGASLSSAITVIAVLLVSVAIDTILAALGGALVVKFTSDK